MRTLSYLGLLAGLLILTLLVVWGGVAEILRLLLASGWSLLWLPVVWFPTSLVTVLGWRPLFIPPRIPPFWHLYTAMWIGRSINVLLPVATIGGEIAKARLIVLWGANAKEAGASVVLDKTIQAVSIIMWGMIGIVLLSQMSVDHAIVWPAIIGSSLLGLGLAGFIVVQHAGMFKGLSSFLSRFVPLIDWDSITHHAHETDHIVRGLYRDRSRIAMAVWWRVFSLALETVEIWLACYLLNFPISIMEAILLRSMISLLNSILFFIPNAYGIQEGGFVLVGALIGMSPELALAVSLATRLRELIIDLPGLLAWQYVEGRHFFTRKRALSPRSPG